VADRLDLSWTRYWSRIIRSRPIPTTRPGQKENQTEPVIPAEKLYTLSW